MENLENVISNLTARIDELSRELYKVRSNFSEQHIDAAMQITNDIRANLDYKCGTELLFQLKCLKTEGKMTEYRIDSINRAFAEVRDFYNVYSNIDNDNHEHKLTLAAIKITCQDLYDSIDTADTLEEFKEDLDSFIETINDLISEFED